MKKIEIGSTVGSQLILSGDAYSNFCDTIKSQATRSVYNYGLVQFMKFLAVTDVNNLMVLAQDQKVLQQKIIDYIKFLKDKKGCTAVTISGYLSSIMHFFAMNDVILNRKRIGRYIPERMRRNKDRAYSREEITRLLEFCDLRNRAIVLLFASTGMRIGAVPALRIEHLRKVEQFRLYQITVYEGYPEEYTCFCTPECAKAIDAYLQHRQRCGEALTPKSPLFRQQFDVTDQEQIRKSAYRITRSTIVKALTKALHLSSVTPIEQLKEGETPSKHKRKKIMKSHGFRKFVNTTMINCRIDSSVRNKLLGHSIALDNSYWRPQVDDLLQEYLKCADSLTINEENRLRRKVEELELDVTEIQKFKQELDNLKALVSDGKGKS